MHAPSHWVGTWTTAPAPAEGGAFANQTLRMNARVSIGGDTRARAAVERLWHPAADSSARRISACARRAPPSSQAPIDS